MSKSKPTQGSRIESLEEQLASLLKRFSRLERKVRKIGKKERPSGREGRHAPAPPTAPPEAPPATKRKRQDPPAAVPAPEPDATQQDAHAGALAVYNAAAAAGRKRGRPKKQPAPPGALEQEPPSSAAQAGPEEAAEDVFYVPDPRGSMCCYNALGVPRAATPEDIKRAFRRLALRLHPDKATGNAKAFVCVNQAFELLMDPKQRSMYDLELLGMGSKDGLACSTVESAETDIVATTVARADMVADLFLSIRPEAWPELLALLADSVLPALAAFLEGSELAPEAPADAQAGRGGQAPGIVREGSRYRGKITFDNFKILTFPTAELSEAVDGRIALVKLKSRVDELRGQGTSFDDACRTAVKEIRASEQVAAFCMYFAFEFRPKGEKRYTTPRVVDLDEVLRDRTALLELGPKNPNTDTVHTEMHKRCLAARRERTGKKRQLQQELLRLVLEQLKQKTVVIPIAPSKRMQVIGPRHLGVLSEPRLGAEVVRHLEAGQKFVVTRQGMLPGSACKFFGGAENWGWVPEFSRKDPTRRVVTEVLLSLEDGETEDEMGSNSDSGDEKGKSSSSSSSSSSS